MILHDRSSQMWTTLIREAQHKANLPLEPLVEFYLVSTLDDYVSRPDAFNQSIVLGYLEASEPPDSSYLRMQELGDVCLLMAGLYNDNVRYRGLATGMYDEVGQSAYHHVSQWSYSQSRERARLFCELSSNFTRMRRVLMHTSAVATL